MIEMDQFVKQLSGSPLEIIARQSRESAATMKDTGLSIRRFETGCLFQASALF